MWSLLQGAHEGPVSLTILHFGAELSLLGVLEDRVVAGVHALHGAVTAGLVKESAITTRSSTASKGGAAIRIHLGTPWPASPGAPKPTWHKQRTCPEAHQGAVGWEHEHRADCQVRAALGAGGVAVGTIQT